MDFDVCVFIEWIDVRVFIWWFKLSVRVPVSVANILYPRVV